LKPCTTIRYAGDLCGCLSPSTALDDSKQFISIAPLATDYRKELKSFYNEWENEASRLKTPSHDKGSTIIRRLINDGQWAPVEPYTDATVLFDRIPTVEDLIVDLHYAEHAGKLILIDSRSSKPDGLSAFSAKNLLECISSVEKKSFGVESVHYAMVEMEPSPGGLDSCVPKRPPKDLLTMSGSEIACRLHRFPASNI
jgi:hypothetical protein